MYTFLKPPKHSRSPYLYPVVIIAPWFLRFFTLGTARAMALFPFIIVLDRSTGQDPVLLNHEKIHFRQQLEMCLLPFYLWYVAEYALRLIIYRSHFKAYRNISFEREAYAMDSDADYLEERDWMAFAAFL